MSPAVFYGSSAQCLITYAGWCSIINNRPTNTNRVWAKFYPFVGTIGEAENIIPGARLKLVVYPNPMTSEARINYALLRSSSVDLVVYNASGQFVRKLVSEPSKAPGSYSVCWDGRNDQGRRVPAGVYFYRLKAGSFTDTKKLVVVR
jgi:hypothetical protein